jgi:uncharacterized protein (TIGR02145 family)
LGLDVFNNAALDTKVDKVAGKGLSTNDYSTAEKNKLEVITGTNTGDQDLSGYATTTQLATKANASDVTAGLANKVDKENGKGLSSNDYTTAEKAKLASITGISLQGPAGPIGLTGPAGPRGQPGSAGAAGLLSSGTTAGNTTYWDGSQWVLNNSNLFNNGSNLGLGTITPSEKLDVVGNVKASGTVTAGTVTYPNTHGSANQVLSTTGSGTLAWTTAAAAGVPYTGATQSVNLGAYDLIVHGLTIGRGGGNVDGNTANGSMSLNSNSFGNSNTAYGYASLYSNTTGSSNIANGNQSLYFNTSGSNNTAIGNASLNNNTIGSDNTANGFGALYLNTGGYNTANGSRSLYSTTTGVSNTALGYSAGTTNTTGSQNTLIGYSADVSSNNLSNATALGNQAIVTASNTIQLGNTSVTDVKTSGTITAGDVTYPNTHGSANQVLSTTGSGTLAWTTPSTPSGANLGDMQYWNGTTWVVLAVTANEGASLQMIGGVPTWTGGTPPSVTSLTGRVWMDRNLGATRVAISSTDAASYGDYYQWGRGADGHQIKTSTTTSTLSSTDSPGNGNFINNEGDWRSSPNVNLWQGVTGINNPCPSGYRIPTILEWGQERATWSTDNAEGAFASALKLPSAGQRIDRIDMFFSVGEIGYYWSSTVNEATTSRKLYISAQLTDTGMSDRRATGLSVRCIKD